MHDSPPVFTLNYAGLPDQFHEAAKPVGFPSAEIIKLNYELASQLGINEEWLRSNAGTGMVTGNQLPQSTRPIAQAYAGHQFGGFVPRLGDGRAILLGELCGFDIQLKGAGPTKFSRGGDGKSALGPVIREYLVSEAMHALGAPTTRALAAVATNEPVFRQDGPEPGGIFTRVARSHIRVGTFQYFAARQDRDALTQLVDHCGKYIFQKETDALGLLREVTLRQARLIAHWMSLGFIHGVMNTDNCAISGHTIDYGPCAFMDEFHPKCVFSSIDRDGRYSWENQAMIGHWNVTRLAEALLPLIDSDNDKAVAKAKTVLAEFSPEFKKEYLMRFRSKIGHTEAPESMIDATLSHLANQRGDFTIFFQQLTRLAHGQGSGEYFDKDWLENWKQLGEPDAKLMAACNPVFIPRNHQVQRAISDAYQGNFETMRKLNCAWRNPFVDNPENRHLTAPPTESERVRETFCGT